MGGCLNDVIRDPVSKSIKAISELTVNIGGIDYCKLTWFCDWISAESNFTNVHLVNLTNSMSICISIFFIYPGMHDLCELLSDFMEKKTCR